MLFNTYSYFVFLPIVLLVYYLLPTVKFRNLFLLLASYFFYMCWQPVFVLLILVSTITDFFIGKRLSQTEDRKSKLYLLGLSLFVNIGILFYFKYFNFLSLNLEQLISWFGFQVDLPSHSLLLPVGISFYTFQTLSYTIDTYRDSRNVETCYLDFSLFVAFFPQLVAGPIERSTNLLPQLKKKQVFDYDRFRFGGVLILLGLFKKLVFADRFAIYSDEIFSAPELYNGLNAILGIVFFSFQIYGDFSGYTDIAIGSAILLGFTLMDNFKGPYMSRSIREFWQRWHISLSTWFRDYLYIPLGGNRLGSTKTYRNLVIVFLITALWHGANWTYIVWGMIHGLFLILERKGFSKLLDRLPSVLAVFYVFVISALAWTFFRAESLTDATVLLKNVFIYEEGNFWNHNIFEDVIDTVEMQISLVLLLVAGVLHYFEYKYNVAKAISNAKVWPRWLFYIVCILTISYLGEYGSYKEFIYFQF